VNKENVLCSDILMWY